MRILQVTPTFFSDRSVVGGGERYVSNVCAAVRSASDGSPVRCDMLSFASERALIPIGPGIDLHLIPGIPADLVSFAGDALDDCIGAYDVIHVHQCLLPSGFFVAARARLAGKVVVGTDHGGGETQHLEAFPVLGAMYDAFHAQSEFAASAFTQLRTPVHVIYGPVDETMFPLSCRPREPSLFVTLGRFLPHKGYEHAIRALPEGATLVIVGRPYDDPYFSFLRAQAQGKDVRFETGLDDQAVASLLGRAGACLHTGVHVDYVGHFRSKPELLALAPLEAMCAGTPSVVSSAGALPELARLAGCRSYAEVGELAGLLRAQAAGSLSGIEPEAIRRDAVEKYGLAQFGAAYLRMIAGIRAGMAS